MMGTIEKFSRYTLVNCGPEDRGGCGMAFAMTQQFYDQTHRTGETWYCPKGHPRVWGGDSIERKLQKEQARSVALGDQLRAAIEDAETARVALIRERSRIANGVCPCCNRSFENVARHIKGQHPDYDVNRIKLPKYHCGCGARFDSFRGLRIHQGQMRGGRWSDPKTNRWGAHLTAVAP